MAVLLGLTGFAISQPLLAFLGESPTWFIFRGARGVEVVLLAIAIALVPPAVLWSLGLIGSLIDKRAGAVVHLLTCASLAVLAVFPHAHGHLRGVIALALSMLAGAGLVLLYIRSSVFASWLRYLAVLPVIAVLAFVFGSSTGDFARASQQSPSSTSTGDQLPPVVFIVLDEFGTQSLLDSNADIDPIRYPNLAEFGESATWFRHYTALTTHTTYSVPSMLTGRWPAQVEPLWSNYPETLFTLLSPTHDVVAFEQFTSLCSLPSCQETSGGLYSLTADAMGAWSSRLKGNTDVEGREDFREVLLPASDPNGDGGGALKNVPARHQAFLEMLAPADRPKLLFQHLVLPHAPFTLYPDGTTYDRPMDYPETTDPWLQATDEQRHLLQASYTDALVGQTLAALKESGQFDESLVVIASDHGISFDVDTSRRDYVPGTIDEHAYSLLMIKAPAQTVGGIDDANLLSVDILPTITDMMGVLVPWELDGYPAGHEAVADRGRLKPFWDVSPIRQGAEFREVIEFDDGVEFPEITDRWVGEISATDDPVSGLLRLLDSYDLIGREVDQIPVSGEVQGELSDPDSLQDGGTPTKAFIEGTVVAPEGAEVLVAVDGVIVSGSKLFADDDERGRFAAILPASHLAGSFVPELFLYLPDGEVRKVRVDQE